MNPNEYLAFITERLYGRTYNKENPEAVKFDVFSASVLSSGPFKQVRMKIASEPFSTTRKIMVGNSIHDYIQGMLTAKGGTEAGEPAQGGRVSQFIHEFKLSHEIPFAWENIDAKRILILGHVDTLDLWNHQIMEFKYSEMTGEAARTLSPIYITQAGFYATKVSELFGIPHGARVIRVNDDATEYVLTEDDKLRGYAHVLKNAVHAAAMIDSWLGMKKEEKKA